MHPHSSIGAKGVANTSLLAVPPALQAAQLLCPLPHFVQRDPWERETATAAVSEMKEE